MTIPTLTTLPVAPARTDPPATFVTRADAFLAAIVTFQGEMNTSIGAMNTDIAQVNADATAAAASETAAAASATAAANTAGAALWVSGQAYAEGDAAISGVDYQTYRAETATSGTTDPSADANWTKISGVLPAESGNAGKFLTTDGSTASWAAIETGTITATASGALTNGCPVVVNSNGTVSKTYRAQQTEATGSQTTISNITMSGVANEVPMLYVPDTEDLFFAITKSSSEEIFLRRVSVTGTTISGGPSNQLTPSGTEGRYQQMAYIGSSKIAIVYRAHNDGGAGRVVIATVAEDGTATFGTELEFVSDSNAMSVSYDSDNDKILIAYRDDSDGDKGKAVIGTVTGTTVTLGTPVVMPNSRLMGTKYELKSIYIPEQELWVILHRGSGSDANNLFLRSYSNDGTTLTHIDEATVSNQQAEYIDLSYAPDKAMLMVAWSDQSDSDNGKAKNYYFTGGASGKNFSNIDFEEWEGGAVNGVNIEYDPNAKFWYLTYWNLNQSSYPYRRYLKVDGSGTISTDNESVLVSQNTNKVGMAYHDAEFSHVMFFTEWGVAHKIGYDVTNLTADSYIGISNADYADAATATVQIIGAVDDAQTGLTAGTKAYVQRNGTIGTSADTPSVVAGTAISATKIIVKG